MAEKTPQTAQKSFLYSWDALAGTTGCHLCIRRRHPSRNMALIHSFMGAERAGKGVGGPALNPHLLERTYTLIVCARRRNWISMVCDHRCHMGVIGVPEVKKSIFRLWSGIVLG